MTFQLPDKDEADKEAATYPDVVWFIVDKTTGIWRISVAYRSEAEAWKQINAWSRRADISNMEARAVGIQDWGNW